jgi:DNA-binding transcriptional ArsR family regulator
MNKDELNMKSYLEACCTIDLSDREQEKMVAMFNALGNPSRFEVMKFLVTHNGCYTSEIVDHLPQAQATVSQHLKVLDTAGWVDRLPEGTATSICLNKKNISWFKEKIGDIF